MTHLRPFADVLKGFACYPGLGKIKKLSFKQQGQKHKTKKHAKQYSITLDLNKRKSSFCGLKGSAKAKCSFISR